ARAVQYPPEKVAEITGVPASDIRKLAREYATVQPSAIRQEWRSSAVVGEARPSERSPACPPSLAPGVTLEAVPSRCRSGNFRSSSTEFAGLIGSNRIPGSST